MLFFIPFHEIYMSTHFFLQLSIGTARQIAAITQDGGGVWSCNICILLTASQWNSRNIWTTLCVVHRLFSDVQCEKRMSSSRLQQAIYNGVALHSYLT